MSLAQLSATWNWAGIIGYHPVTRVWDRVVDNYDSIILADEFVDTVWVDEIAIQGMGLADSFIIKYDVNGTVQRVRINGSPKDDVCLSIDTDARGNCYFGGSYNDTLHFGTLQDTLNGLWDVFYGKLFPVSNLLWLRNFGGISQHSTGLTDNVVIIDRPDTDQYAYSSEVYQSQSILQLRPVCYRWTG